MPLDYPATGSCGWDVSCRFYLLKASPKGFSLNRFPKLSK